MSESFRVQSSLHISTNVEAVIHELIEGFAQFDRILNETQAKLNGVRENAGKEGNTLKEAFAQIKLPRGIVGKFEALAGHVKTFATESQSAAKAWREIAEASRNVRRPRNPGGGGGGGGGGGRGGGHGDDEWPEYGPPTMRQVLRPEDQLSAKYWNQDFDAERKFQQKLMSDEQKAVVQKIAQREKLEREQAKFEQGLLEREQKAVIRQIAERDKLERERAQQERRLMAEEQRAVQDAIDAREKQTRAILQDIARNNKKDMAAGDVYGPPTLHQAVQGRPDERKNAETENDRLTAEERARLAQLRAQEVAAHKNGIHYGANDFAMDAQMLSQGPMAFLLDSFKKSVDVQEGVASLRHNNTITDAQAAAIEGRALEINRLVEGSTTAGNIKAIADAFNITNNLEDALKVAPQMAEAEIAFEHVPGMHKGDHAFAALQAQELLQHIYNKETHQIDSEEMMRGVVAEERVAFGTQGRDKPEDYRALAKQSRAAGMLADDQFLYEDLPAVQIAMGGHRAGTALAGGYREFIRGTMTKGVAEELKNLHLLDKDAKWSGGRVIDMEHKFHGYDLFQRNEVEWTRKVGLPTLQSLGVNTNDPKQIEDKVTKIGSTNVVLGWISEMMVGMEGINKEAEKLRHTDMDANGKPINPMDVIKQYSPKYQIEVASAAINELQVTLGKFMMGDGLKGLRALTDGIHTLDDFLTNHPHLGKDLTEIAVGLSVLGSVAGFVMTLGFVSVIGKWGKSLLSFGADAKKAGTLLGEFAEGGAARLGLLGMMSVVGQLIAAIAIWKYALAPNKSIASQHEEDKQIGKEGSDASRFDHFGQAPGLKDKPTGVMGYFQKLFDKSSYYHDPVVKPDSLVAPAPGSKGPVPVHVTNQLDAHDIASGVSAHQADKANRPPSGYTGSDIRVDPTAAYFGGLIAPF